MFSNLINGRDDRDDEHDHRDYLIFNNFLYSS
jgi:hypothetical protein